MSGRTGGNSDRPILVAAMGLALLASADLVGGENASQTPLTEQEIDRAIQQLGDPGFTVRERASRRLWQAGKAAEPALEKALSNPDAEVVYRARQLLDKFRWGIYPDTPPKTAEAINLFRGGDAAVKEQVCQRLASEQNFLLLRRLIEREPDPALRATLLGRFQQQIAQAAKTAALAQGDFDTAAQLLETATSDESIRDYVALLLARGKLDAGIARLKEELDRQPEKAGHKRLAYLLRAKGDLAGAVDAAKKAAEPRLVEGLLVEAGDWPHLARAEGDKPAGERTGAEKGIVHLGHLAAYSRLAGDAEGVQRAVAAIIKLTAEPGEEPWFITKALLINERFDEAIEHCARRQPNTGFELLGAQLRFREAFHRVGLDDPALVPSQWLNQAAPAGAKEGTFAQRFGLAALAVRAWHRLGEKEKAQDLLAAMTAAATSAQDKERAGLLSQLARCEADLGLHDRAAEHAAMRLSEKEANVRSVLYDLFKKESDIAEVWWRVLRIEHPDENAAETLQRIRGLLAGGRDAPPVKELRRLAGRAETLKEDDRANPSGDEADPFAPAKPAAGSDAHARRLLALATFFQKRGHRELASLYAEKAAAAAPTADVAVGAAELLAGTEQWSEVVRACDRAWQQDKKNVGVLYLLGLAGVRLGRESEGRRQMDLACLLPLGDARARYYLAETLNRLKLADEAARQHELGLRTGGLPGDWAVGQCRQGLANAARKNGDYSATARHWETMVLACLHTNTSFIDVVDYLRVNFRVHWARGLGLLKAGNAAGAVEEFRKAEAALPGDVTYVLETVPELERAGRAADALFQRAFALHEEVCRDFPRSALEHNQAAWTAAVLGRELDKALDHARRAVELEPEKAAYLDTLAEVHFHRGDRAEALRLQQRAVELEPQNEQLRERLQRFAAP